MVYVYGTINIELKSSSVKNKTRESQILIFGLRTFRFIANTSIHSLIFRRQFVSFLN